MSIVNEVKFKLLSIAMADDEMAKHENAGLVYRGIVRDVIKWLDESPSIETTEYIERERQELTQAYIDEQDKSEKLQQEIQRLKELLEREYKQKIKIIMGYGEDEAWQQFKQTNNI